LRIKISVSRRISPVKNERSYESRGSLVGECPWYRLAMPPEDVVDRLDREIIGHLQEDGRRSFREIARAVGVSEATVRARYRRLQESGTLRILAFADPFQLGGAVLALILIRVEADAHLRLAETLASWPEVTYVSSLMGRADMYAQVICRDNEALWQLVGERLRTLDGVLESETMLEMKVHKFTYAVQQELLE
jgi:Lrp/AsnC family transcriptional regulator for asnA, asnC and gidA